MGAGLPGSARRTELGDEKLRVPRSKQPLVAAWKGAGNVFRGASPTHEDEHHVCQSCPCLPAQSHQSRGSDEDSSVPLEQAFPPVL